MDIVDRTYEKSPEDQEITVTLENGFKVDFWMTGLTNKEYIRRTKLIQKIEANKPLYATMEKY